MAENENLTLPLLITRGLVLFPGCSTFIEAARSFTLNAVKQSKVSANSLILVVSQKDASIETPTLDDVYHFGTLCRIASVNDRGTSSRSE